MGRQSCVAIVSLMLLLTIPLSHASADPIVLTGRVVVSHPGFGATGHLQGLPELIFSDPMFFGSGISLCGPCGAPGMPISLNGVMNTDEGGGTVEIAGQFYSFGGIGGGSNAAYMGLSFLTDPVVLPPLSPTGVISTRFRLGHDGLLIWDENGFPGPVFSLTGQGTATMGLIQRNGLWEFGGLRYDFEPVPEPSTVLLVSTGIVALGRVRRKRPPAKTDR